MFAHFHRHSYCGCKTAVSEVIASQAALVADVNGITKYPHVQEKISHIIGTAELVFAAGQMSAYRATEFPNGSWVPDEILTNAGRRIAGNEIYHEYEVLADLTRRHLRLAAHRGIVLRSRDGRPHEQVHHP